MAKQRTRVISLLLIAAMVFIMTGQHVLPVRAEEGTEESTSLASYVYQAEDYYSGTIVEDVAADMQPGESITFTLDEDFVSGRYTLSVYSCGNRENFTVKVNGSSVGTISRSGTDYGQDQMTLDTMSAEVKLEAGNEITIVAPDGGYYGWVDYIQLDQVTYYTYQAEDYYSGNISESVAADMQPGESIAITLNTNGDFAAGTYTLSIYSCGNRESFEILVNGESVGNLTRTGTNFGLDQMTLDELTSDKVAVELELGTDDVITIVAPDDGSSYGWVDYMRLYSVSSDEEDSEGESEEPSEEESEDPSEDESEEPSEDESEEPSEEESEEPSEEESEEPSEEESEEPSEEESEEPSEEESEEPSEEESEEPSEDESEDPDKEDTTMPDGATETGDGYYVYQIEYYYSGTTVEEVAADMQPGDKIDVALNTNSDFVAGTYTLTVYSCGNREEIQILVNGKSVGTITRTGTGFGQDQMTYDVLSVELDLKPTDTITLYASDSGYGWVDFMILSEEDADTSGAGTSSSGSGSSSSGGSSSGSSGTSTSVLDEATETGDGYYVYQVEYYYSGTIVEDVAADMQPGESISIAVSSNADFVAGTYTLTIYSCGNRESFEILVNGVSVGTVTRTGTGFGQDQMTYDLLSTQIYLEPGDVITLVAPGGAYYGWVDFMILSTEESDTSTLTFSLNSAASATALSSTSSDATEAYDDYLIYQAEYYYTPIAEEVTADLQPGESIDIDVSTNSGFTPGTYTLTVCSCGNREEFDIQVNGVSVGTINRTGTGFGLDQMTYDKLTSTVLELEENDVISLVGQSGEYYGWVDFIVLDRGDTTDSAASASDYEADDSDDADSAILTGDTYFIYQGEDFYEPIVEEAADLQPGESITFELNTNSEFTSGTYVLTVSSCGNREEFDVQVNGVSVGTITRTGTGFGMDQMTNDQLATTLDLETDDTITIVSPDGEVYGWVDYIRLDLVTDAEEASEELISEEDTEEEESTGDDTQNDSEADVTSEDTDDSNGGSGAWIPVVIGIIAVLCGGGIIAAVIITRRRRNTAGAENVQGSDGDGASNDGGNE